VVAFAVPADMIDGMTFTAPVGPPPFVELPPDAPSYQRCADGFAHVAGPDGDGGLRCVRCGVGFVTIPTEERT
jgi:hypothetical protein